MTMHCCDRLAIDLNQTCDSHSDRAACPDAMIAQVRGGYGLYVRSGENGYGSGVIEIAFCLWCGAEFPPIGETDLSLLPADDE